MNKIENKLNTKINIEEQLKQLYPHCKDIKVLWESHLSMTKEDIELLDSQGNVEETLQDAIYLPGSGGCSVLTEGGHPRHLGALEYGYTWRLKDERKD